MKTRTKTAKPTALETFETRKALIAIKASRLTAALLEYDREISSVPGGHLDWGHAGTLEHVTELLDQALEAIQGARDATRGRAIRHTVTRGDHRRRNVP